MRKQCIELGHKKICVLEIYQKAQVQNQREYQPQAFETGMAHHELRQHKVDAGRPDEVKKKISRPMKIKKVAEEKKRCVSPTGR